MVRAAGVGPEHLALLVDRAAADHSRALRGPSPRTPYPPTLARARRAHTAHRARRRRAASQEQGVISAFNMSKDTLSNFLNVVFAGYHNNPYHNFQHAISVLHACCLLLSAGNQSDGKRTLDPLHTLALLVAALGHDIDHPGVSNAFIVNSGSPLALCYNDESVLENHHAATTFTLLADKRNDILETLEPSERRIVRQLVCKCILATDMAHHSELVRQITRLGADHTAVEPVDVLTSFLHLADLSNPVLQFPLSKRWALLVCDEFSAQARCCAAAAACGAGLASAAAAAAADARSLRRRSARLSSACRSRRTTRT